MSGIRGKAQLTEKEKAFVNNVQPIQEKAEKPVPVRPEPKIHKTIRMPKWISDELMREAMEESIRTGVRITQEGIVQAILEERYKDRK